jgi:hypothetical protein
MVSSVEFLAEEFKRLVGWGAHPRRLPLLINLASLANVPDEATFVTAGYIVRRYLVQAIDSLDGTREFQGRSIKGEKLQRAYRLLFQIEGVGLSAANRRYRAIQALGLSISVDQWRRPVGAEFELMMLLAEEMMAD